MALLQLEKSVSMATAWVRLANLQAIGHDHVEHPTAICGAHQPLAIVHRAGTAASTPGNHKGSRALPATHVEWSDLSCGSLDVDKRSHADRDGVRVRFRFQVPTRQRDFGGLWIR
jgi:hypothetical protein